MMDEETSTTTTSNDTNFTEESNITTWPPCYPEVIWEPAPAPLVVGACRCGEPAARGLEVWVALTAEQARSFWCQLGSWAPVGLGLLMFWCHGFTAACVGMQARRIHNEWYEIVRLDHLKKKRQRAKELNKPVTEVKVREPSPILTFLQITTPAEPLPEKVNEYCTGRHFEM